MQRYQRQKDISESDAKPKAQKCNILLKEKRSPPANTASCCKKKTTTWKQNAQDLLITRRLKLTSLTEDTGTLMERARLGSLCSRVLVVLIFALKQDIVKLKQSACCQRYLLKEEEGAHCLQIGAYLTFLISWLIVKERLTGAVKSEEKTCFSWSLTCSSHSRGPVFYSHPE